LGYVVYLVLISLVGRRTVAGSPAVGSLAVRRLKLPLILMVVAIFADDAIEMAGLKKSWWGDELVAALQSLPLISFIWILAMVCRSYFARMIERNREEGAIVHTLTLINNLITVILVIGGCFALLRIWAINLTPLLASAGLVTAIGALAARDTLADFLGGIAIFLDHPYHIGDFVVLNSGERGEVVDIGIRSTRIRTRDDVFVSIPNSLMATAKVINESSFVSQYRVRCRLGVAYHCDLDEAEKILLFSLEGNPFLLPEPAPRVRYRAFGDWSVELEVLAWIKDPRDRGAALDQIIRGLHRVFREGKIEIPLPQQEVTYKRPENVGPLIRRTGPTEE
jgi:small-conductance mechanosensitive channel